MQPIVIFVGAGPVGLFTAIQTKLYHPDLPILMLEKYQAYQRKHPLLLDQNSFKGTHRNECFQDFIHSLPGKIRTNELEDALLKYARDLGIMIEYKHVQNCAALSKEYPSAKLIIGADGSHSKVHEQIFRGQYQIQKTLQYIAEIKYEVKGETRTLGTLLEAVLALKYSKHLVSEFVGKEHDGKTPVSLRIFIDEKTYQAMQAATFKDPFSLNEPDKIEPELYKTIQTWLMAREDMTRELRVPGSERITVTNLPVYASKEFVKKYDNKLWFLVGDSAFGVPYFRSLNNGILCSSQLAKTIDALICGRNIEKEFFSSSKFSGLSKEEITPTEFYHRYVQTLLEHEDFMAELKNFGVGSLETSASSLRILPQKSVKFSLTEGGARFKEHLRERNGEAEQDNFSNTSFAFFGNSSKEDDLAKSRPTRKSCLIV